MKTNAKVLLTAIGIAVLASPVMAKSSVHAAPPAISTSGAYGSVAGTSTAPIVIDDAVHVAFPVQDNGN